MKRISKLIFSTILVSSLLFSGCQKKSDSSSKIEPQSGDTSSEFVPTWGEPTYTWSNDYSKCEAKRICNEKPDLIQQETAQSTYVVTEEAKCEVEGVGIYTAKFNNSYFKTQTIEVAIPAIGHLYNVPVYEWSDDNSACTATRVCSRDASHIETETVESVEHVITPTTYESAGQSRFVATFTNPAFAEQEKTVNFDKLDNLIFTLRTDKYSVKVKQGTIAKEINIPSTYNSLPVTTIDSEGFAGDSCDVKKIVIPTSISDIPYNTFLANTHIVEIDGLPKIYDEMFNNCLSLRKLVFAESYQTIMGDYHNCRAEDIVIPGAVTVSPWAFENDSFVKNITLGKNVNSVGDYAFLYTGSLESINVDPECTKFFSDNGVLYERNNDSSLTLHCYPASKPDESYTLQAGTTVIKSNSFNYVRCLKELTLNSEFKRFYGEEFYETFSIRKITITNSEILMSSERIFTLCYSLKEVILPDGSNYVCQNGLIMDKSKSVIYYILGGYEDVITIPMTVGTIKDSYAHRSVRTSGFKVEEGNNHFSAENGILMNKDKTSLLRYPYKSNETIINKDSIPSTVISIGKYSISGYSHVTEIDLSETNVTECLFGAFSSNTGLTKIKFPSSITNIGPYIISDCLNVSTLEFPMTKQEFLTNVGHNSWLDSGPETVNAVFTDVTVEAHTL